MLFSLSCKQEHSEPALMDEELSSFTQLNGDAHYSYSDGILTGVSKMGIPNSFLATKKTYGDFILSYEVMVDEGLNSGVQIRSLSSADYQDGRVHGYQVEIDTSPRRWSGGIYDEGRRGWLYPLSINKNGLRAFKNGQWNRYRVEAIGDTIKTWINDVPIAHMVDDMTAEGFIAFQVHSIYDEKDAGKKVHWKNISIETENLSSTSKTTAPQESYLNQQITEEEVADGWQLLADDLNLIESDEGSYEIKFDFKMLDSVKTDRHYAEDYSFSLYHNDAKYPVGSLLNLASAKNLSEDNNPSTRYKGLDQWNRAHIIVSADKIQHWLNGIKVVDHPITSVPKMTLSPSDNTAQIYYKNWKVKL